MNESKTVDLNHGLSHRLARLRSEDKYAAPPINDIPIIDEKIQEGKSMKLVSKS